MDSGVEYEFRTTVVKSLLKKVDLEKIASLIKGARLYVLQKFVPSKCLDKKYLIKTTYSDEDFEAMAVKLKDLVQRVIVR
jgi:pyruvate formate lyase activating enzyme